MRLLTDKDDKHLSVRLCPSLSYVNEKGNHGPDGHYQFYKENRTQNRTERYFTWHLILLAKSYRLQEAHK